MTDKKRVLVLFGAGKDSLGEDFSKCVHQMYYPDILLFDLEKGFDATEPRDMRAAASRVSDHIHQMAIRGEGSPDHELHVVNFVGIMDNGKIEGYDEHAFQKMLTVNVFSLFNIAKAMTPLLQRHNGRFITMGSNAAEMGFTGMSAYCASKHAAHGFVKCMAKEMAPFNVPVNIVNPGAFTYLASRMSHIQSEQFIEQGFGSDEFDVEEKLSSRIPMKRLATNADLNATLVSLLAHMPRYFTGQAVSLSGGMVM